jgi:tetratricopeptide (TPR) repeat protein
VTTASAQAVRCSSCRVVALLLVAVLSACAPKSPPPPASPLFPDFVRPPVAANAPAAAVADLDQAWNQLQAGNMAGAERTYGRVLQQAPRNGTALTGRGYIALARDDADAAVARFDEALAGSPELAAALVGRGQALLRLDRPADALGSFEAAARADPALNLTARIETLRFRVVEDNLARARSLAERSDWDGARAAYEQTLAASPDSAVLYRELASVERRAGLTAEADAHLGRALELDPTDRATHLLLAEIREEGGDFDGAIAAYEAAVRLEPSAEIEARLARARERADLARLPEQFRTLSARPEASRADLAVALALRVPGLLARAPARPTPVITDLRGHWARPWILTAVRSGVLDAFPNHTFQPAAEIRRADLADAVARVLALLSASGDRRVSRWQQETPQFTDLAPAHPAYRAAAEATASGVLTDVDGAFRAGAIVSGQDVLDAVQALQRLAGPLAARDRRSP